MNKLLLASTAALIAALSFASTSQAGSRNHDNDGLFDIDVDINFGAKPRRHSQDVYFAPKRIKHYDTYRAPKKVYYDAGYDGEELECRMQKIKKLNRWGEIVVKKIPICE